VLLKHLIVQNFRAQRNPGQRTSEVVRGSRQKDLWWRQPVRRVVDFGRRAQAVRRRILRARHTAIVGSRVNISFVFVQWVHLDLVPLPTEDHGAALLAFSGGGSWIVARQRLSARCRASTLPTAISTKTNPAQNSLFTNAVCFLRSWMPGRASLTRM
jgi:hypothetical protein